MTGFKIQAAILITTATPRVDVDLARHAMASVLTTVALVPDAARRPRRVEEEPVTGDPTRTMPSVPKELSSREKRLPTRPRPGRLKMPRKRSRRSLRRGLTTP